MNKFSPSFESEPDSPKSPDDPSEVKKEGKVEELEEATKAWQQMHIDAVQKHLPEDDWLYDELIEFFGDTQRLKSEVSNVIEGRDSEEINQWFNKRKERLKDEKNLIDYFQSRFEPKRARERNQAIMEGNMEAYSEIQRETGMKATDQEYEAGVYRDALERPVQDAVFTLRDKGYKTLEPGFRENPKRKPDQFISVRNQNVSIPNDLRDNFDDRGIEITLESGKERTIINFHQTSDQVLRLDDWKQLWDEFADRMPEISEDLSNFDEPRLRKEFREFQDSL